MPRRLVPVALTLLLAVTSGLGSGASSSSAAEDPLGLSLVQLIANPDRYEGKRVRVKGYCHLEFEEQSLYLHREDADLMNTSNAVWLELEASDVDQAKPNEQFVLVEGIFTGKSRGHLGAWSGTIRDITRLERALTRSEFNLIRQLSKEKKGQD